MPLDPELLAKVKDALMNAVVNAERKHGVAIRISAEVYEAKEG